MKKRILICSIIFFQVLIFMAMGWDLYVEIETAKKGLEFVIPIFCNREITRLSHNDFFDSEKLEIMHLSKMQANRVLKK